ncbi:MAG: hypothetical protein ABI947_23440 [Chloroflexota bacterium]
MLKRILPFSLITPRNAAFERDLRRVRWLRRPLALVMYSAYVLIGIPLLVSVLFLLDYFRRSAAGRYGSYYYYYNTSVWFAIILFATFLIMVIANLYYLVITVNSINRLIASGEWDSLRLTPIPERDLVLGKVAVAQVRGWRFMTLDMALRLCAIAFAVTDIAATSNGYPFLTITSLSALLNLGSIVTLCVVYTLEPLWRMRTVVAIGIAVSAGIRNLTFAVLAGFGLVFALHIGLVIVIAATTYGLARLLGSLVYSSSLESLFFGSAALLFGTLVVGFVINYFYRRVQRYALRRAYRTAFRTD